MPQQVFLAREKKKENRKKFPCSKTSNGHEAGAGRRLGEGWGSPGQTLLSAVPSPALPAVAVPIISAISYTLDAPLTRGQGKGGTLPGSTRHHVCATRPCPLPKQTPRNSKNFKPTTAEGEISAASSPSHLPDTPTQPGPPHSPRATGTTGQHSSPYLLGKHLLLLLRRKLGTMGCTSASYAGDAHGPPGMRDTLRRGETAKHRAGTGCCQDLVPPAWGGDTGSTAAAGRGCAEPPSSPP